MATYTYWSGTEAQQHEARMTACRERREQYPDDECDGDGSCTECTFDMQDALRITKADYDRIVRGEEV